MAHVITEDCLGCGVCVDECPVEAISENDTVSIINAELCTDCSSCMDVCPVNAIKAPDSAA